MLFTSSSTTAEQDNLVVILTPYVIDKSEALSKLQMDLGMLEKLQKDYNLKVFEELEKKREGSLSDEVPEKEEKPFKGIL